MNSAHVEYLSSPSTECAGTKLLRLYVSEFALIEFYVPGRLDLADCGVRILWWYAVPRYPETNGVMLEGEPYAFENLACYLAALNGPGKDVGLADLLVAERVVQRIKRMLAGVLE